MAILTVFSDNLNPAQPNLSARFTNGLAFYIDAPLSNLELEIDVFLQVYFPTVTGEIARNLPLTKTIDGTNLLNVTDTESVVTIPSSYLDTGLEMALLFLASDSTFLEVFVVTNNNNSEEDLLEFLIDNLLPLLIDALIPRINTLLVSTITNLLLPSINNLLIGDSVPALPATSASTFYSDNDFI